MGGNFPDNSYISNLKRFEQQRRMYELGQRFAQSLQSLSLFFKKLSQKDFGEKVQSLQSPSLFFKPEKPIDYTKIYGLFDENAGGNANGNNADSSYISKSKSLLADAVAAMNEALADTPKSEKSSDGSKVPTGAKNVQNQRSLAKTQSAGNFPAGQDLPWKNVKITKQMEKAAEKAEEIARARDTVGHCYAAAADAIDISYGKFRTGSSAYEAIVQLRKRPEFKETVLYEKDYDKLKYLPRGAIVVWSAGNGHPHGHISIALGDGREASDHIQQQITNYGTIPHVFIPKEAYNG